jgi:hypothetical protein
MLTTIASRIAYERTFTLAERWERAKEKAAQFVAWKLLPARVCMWVVVRRHADVTRGDQHPDTVKAFDLYKS